MVDKKDVIITAFSCSTKANCSEWAQKYFAVEPIIINVPGGSGPRLADSIERWAKTGDTFRAALKEQKPALSKIKIGRRAIITFSAGWMAGNALLKYPAEIEKLDAYILLDGMHSNDISGWTDFAKKAANNKAYFFMYHSSINPPFISSAKTNEMIFNSANNIKNSNIIIPNYITNAELPKEGLTITLNSSGSLPAVVKHWAKDSYIDSKSNGNMIVVSYSGDERADHSYISWYVGERAWRFLGSLWPAEPIKLPKENIQPKIIKQNIIKTILNTLIAYFKRLTKYLLK